MRRNRRRRALNRAFGVKAASRKRDKFALGLLAVLVAGALYLWAGKDAFAGIEPYGFEPLWDESFIPPDLPSGTTTDADVPPPEDEADFYSTAATENTRGDLIGVNDIIFEPPTDAEKAL